MAINPLKWPSFEQLGRDFYDHLKPALDQLTMDKELDDEALNGLSRLAAWLDAPCVASVKLDGTNVGVDSGGLVVGRNTIVQPGATYQKVDVWDLLASYPERVERLRREIAHAAGEEAVSQVMLYGELVVNRKYDYSQAGIFKGWLCFGALARPSAEDADSARRLATSLRASGYNASANDGRVVLAPNVKLMALFVELGIRTVSDAYQPSGSITGAQWAEHEGTGALPCFRSLRRLLLSEWASRFLIPSEGSPPGEGLVVASELDGRLFKWKHAGEDLGKVPEQLGEAVQMLRGLASSPRAELLPVGLLEVFERLLLVATTTPRLVEANDVGEAKVRGRPQEDVEAHMVWMSALTKFDDPEAVFAQGPSAKTKLEKQLIEQVASDLVKDYRCNGKDAKQRAAKMVRKEMGQRFGIWKQALNSGA